MLNVLINFGGGHHVEHFCEIILNLDKMLFKDISHPELLRLFLSMEQNHLCNFGREHHEEQFCEIILNLDQWFRRFCLKTFLT